VAGHSKWANIKHRKERADAKKGKMFSRVTKEIIVAVNQGGPDPKTNAKLRLVIQKAKEVNLPSDNIERNIKKASAADQGNYDEIIYEIYGHGGVGIICEAMTDNKNRTASDVRIAINKRGGSIATPGAVTFQFDRKGMILVKKEKGVDSDILFMTVSDAGAEDFEEEDEQYVILTPPDLLYQVKGAMDEKGFKAEELTIEMFPKATVDCNKENEEKNLALIEWLEGLDDIDSVYHNMKME
jgi:YebC/PmpR family DNA-binding regulatory protein